MLKHVEQLIERAARAEKADDAMKFSQAACNAANALSAVGWRLKSNYIPGVTISDGNK